MAIDPTKIPQHLRTGLLQLVEALEARRLQYALIGGLAAGYHSEPRFTQDMDFLLQVPQIVLPGLLDDLTSRGFAFDRDATIKAWTQNHMAVLSYHSARIDWLKPIIPLYQHVLDRAQDEQILDRQVRVASPEGLILTKLLAFRSQDQVDIEKMLAANQGQLDLDWIRQEWDTVGEKMDPRMVKFEEMVRQFYLPTQDTLAPSA